jgi:hypothetical protein
LAGQRKVWHGVAQPGSAGRGLAKRGKARHGLTQESKMLWKFLLVAAIYLFINFWGTSTVLGIMLISVMVGCAIAGASRLTDRLVGVERE